MSRLEFYSDIRLTGVIAWQVLKVSLCRFLNVGRCTSQTRLDGSTVVITGASRGIGKATALLLAERGARIIMACNDRSEAQRTSTEIQLRVPNAQIDIVELELSSLFSVLKCANEIKERVSKVDVLVNNAGVMIQDQNRKTEDGHEFHFQVNYLSHFYLTTLLLDRLKGGKVISVSSEAHLVGQLEFENGNILETNACKYCTSKLAVSLFIKELSKRCPEIHAYCVMPGAVNTDIKDRSNEALYVALLRKLLLRTPEEGAQTTLHCILDASAEKESGLHYSECRQVEPYENAKDESKANILWEISTDLISKFEESSTLEVLLLQVLNVIQNVRV